MDDQNLDYLIGVIISLALPGLIGGVLAIILSFGFCICANCPLNCCTKSGYVACGESCEGAPPRFGYSKSCKYGTAIILFVSWVVVIIACSMSYANETHDAVVTFTDLTVKAVTGASVAFQSSNAVVEEAQTDNLYGIGATISDLAIALKSTQVTIDKYSEYIYKGNDIRTAVITTGISLVLVAFVFWIAALATKMRILNRVFATFSVFGMIFAWFAFGVQLPMTVFVDVTCGVYDTVLDNITHTNLIHYDGGAVANTVSQNVEMNARMDFDIPEPVEQIIVSCIETNSYLMVFVNSLNLTQAAIDQANEFIDTEKLPIKKFTQTIALPAEWPADWSDADFATKLNEAADFSKELSDKATVAMDALPAPLRKQFSDTVQVMDRVTTALQTLSKIVLIIASDLSCIYVKSLIVQLSTTVCVDLPQGMATEAWTFFVVAVAVSLTLSLSLNAFEQRMNEGYAPTNRDDNMDGVVLAATKTDHQVTV